MRLRALLTRFDPGQAAAADVVSDEGWVKIVIRLPA